MLAKQENYEKVTFKNNTQIVVVIMMMTKIVAMQIWNKEKILIIKKSYKKEKIINK